MEKEMTVAQLIQVLASVCRYNANGQVCLHIDGKIIPLHHCVSDFLDEGDERKRITTLVAEGDEYYGR
jgi:hypothetical protein